MKWTIHNLSRLLSDKKISPKEILEESISRAMKTKNDNVFVKLTIDRARRECELSEERFNKNKQLGKLDGLPLVWKGSYAQKGEVTLAGSKVLQDYPPEKIDAQVVTQLAKNGCISIGRCNMTEFAFSGLGINPHYGTPTNIFSKEKIPGGSSSGSAIAVGKQIVPFTIGNDTSGSGRIPAAFNELVGFKPTQHRVSLEGVLKLAASLDCISPMCHSVEDLEMIQKSIDPLFRDTNFDKNAFCKNHTLFIPEGFLMSDLEADVAKNFENSIKELEKIGFSIKSKRFESINRIPEIFKQHGTLVGIEAYLNFEPILNNKKNTDKIDPFIRKRLLHNSNRTLLDLHNLHQNRNQIQDLFSREIEGGILLAPTCPITAPNLLPLTNNYELFSKTNQTVLKNTMPISFLNLPSLAMPNGRNHKGQPTSLMISGGFNQDEKVLFVGQLLEKI